MNRTRTTASEHPLRKVMAKMPTLAHTFLLGVLALAGLCAAAQAQTVAAATAANTAILATISGNAGHVAANSLGDAFYVSQGANTLFWLPRGATTPIALLTGLSGGRNAFVDSANNVYVPNTYSGSLIEVPYVNGTYASGTSSVSACTTVTPTAPCSQGSAGATLAYYYQPSDVAMDGSGNLYVIDVYPNGQCTSGNCVVEFPRVTSGSVTTYGTPVVIKNTIEASNNNSQLAVAPNGDIYYANAKVLDYIAAGTTTVTTVGTFTSPAGVSVDKLGNVYVTDNSLNKIYELPALNGVAQPSKQFSLLNTYSANGVGVDGIGDIYYTAYSGGTNLSVAHLNGIIIGSAVVGTPVSTTATSIQFTFSTGSTVAAITSSGAGFTYAPGSCAAGAFAAASSCTVNVTYTPTAVGLQRGAISLNNAAGASIASAQLSGVGLGAAETNDPGTVTAIGTTTFTSPQGIRLDSTGNVFVADAGQNAVFEFVGGAGAGISIGTGLSKPSSVATDGLGNVFIADAGNGRIVEVPDIAGVLTNSAQSVIATGLGTTLSIAIDRYDNLYLADGATPTISKLPSLGGVPSTTGQTAVGSGFSIPFAVTTDTTGNIFVADYSTSKVTEIMRYGGSQATVGSGFSKPSGLVTDASGSLYVADSGNSRLVKIPLEGTAFNTNDQYLVGSTVAVPYKVDIDTAGNLYVTDNKNAVADKITRTAGTLNLGRAQILTTTAASNAYVGNEGNAPLTLGTPDYTAVSATPSYFTVTSPATAGCANGGTVAAGYSCILAATFSPTTVGTFTDTLTFSSNAINAATKTLTITGRGLNLATTTTTLTQISPTGTAAFGSNIIIQAAIASATAGTPTGTVTFSVDGAPVSNPPTVANGVASVTLMGLTGGTHVVTASYTGDDNFAPSNGSLTITVSKAATGVLESITATATAPVSAVPGSSVTLTAVVVPSASTAPTQTVTFTAGTQVLGTAQVGLVGNVYQATLMTTALPIGIDTVTAAYSGDVNYAASSGNAVVVVSYETFTLTPGAATITVPSGSTGSTTLTATSLSGFATGGAFVGLTCAGLPANSSCSFSPNGFEFQSTQAVTLSIITGQTPVIPQPVTGAGMTGDKRQLPIALLLLAAGTLPLLTRRRRMARLHGRLLAIASVLLLGMGITTLSGCGGSQLFGVTPKGTYQVTVTATSSDTANYSGPTAYATGCFQATDVGPYSTTIPLTCKQTATVTLVVQ